MRPTFEQFDEALAYNEETGVLSWKIRPSARTFPGDVIKAKDTHGYVMFGFKNKTFLAHRVIWLLKTGEWPALTVDHINLDRADNRWLNLRAATKAQNCANQPARRTNRSGLKGAYWHKAASSWTACFRGKYLGIYPTKEAAHAAYSEAAEKYFGEFARTA